MKFIVAFSFGVLIAIAASIRPYTTPSPFGSYRLKQAKCTCNDQIYIFLHRNFTCFAKALSRDVTTINGYAMVKKQIDKGWISFFVEYKYGTIYRTIMSFPKIEGCDLIANFKNKTGPVLRTIYKYIVMYTEVYESAKRILQDGCPLKVNEEFSVYNMSPDARYMPSVFNQGDYRVTIQVFMKNPDNLVCNNTIIASVTSPFKESFGRK